MTAPSKSVARTATGYSRLTVDVRNVAVPERWSRCGCEFEYRHGFGKGLERDGIYNPVPHRPVDIETAEGVAEKLPRREAWFAGYRAGKKARRQERAS